jgi:hypothetical protein
VSHPAGDVGHPDPGTSSLRIEAMGSGKGLPSSVIAERGVPIATSVRREIELVPERAQQVDSPFTAVVSHPSVFGVDVPK